MQQQAYLVASHHNTYSWCDKDQMCDLKVYKLFISAAVIIHLRKF